jgi:hypothetical protein
MEFLAVGIAFVAIGAVYIKWPMIFRRGIWLKTSMLFGCCPRTITDATARLRRAAHRRWRRVDLNRRNGRLINAGNAAPR